MAKYEEISSMLSKSLEEKDRKILKIEAEIQTIENENKNLKNKLNDVDKKSYELSVLLLKYYEDVLEGKMDVKINEGSKE